jgi:cysteine-rich repeat protein
VVRRLGLKLTWLFGGATGAACVAGIVLSCLPDLDPPVVPSDASASVCGNGIIEPGEECDPGPDGAVPGCSIDCRIECDAGEGLPSYVDRASNHCYFQLSAEGGPFEAGSACARHRAHVVTLGSPPEGTALQKNLEVFEKVTYWLGEHADPPDAAGLYSAVIDEPGFVRGDVGQQSLKKRKCQGCYAPAALKDSGDGGACLTWPLRDPTSWSATSCEDSFATLCEREPAGRRAINCNDTWCFDLQVNVNGNGARTTYYLFPTKRVPAAQAPDFCKQLPGGGTKSLVVFETYEQREQIFYELMNLQALLDGGSPTDFWIGATYEPSEGGWTTDNGETFFPYWAGHEPMTTQTGARAYATQSSDGGYETPGTTFDTQLMHADPPPDAGPEKHGVLCQIIQ